ncbi:hypothetical protein, partial [Dysgonomonas sp. 520]|uniref:hypothetical protein n=1 Tax=Dysgonomonas sp. 520 TaxID=2302931 RepID=UPI001C883230
FEHYQTILILQLLGASYFLFSLLSCIVGRQEALVTESLFDSFCGLGQLTIEERRRLKRNASNL